ncbi:MAG: 30S ribosomal protein S18 [Candidatus Pacebacteria bacterium]|nr:30S ribosomal protein S18 [Candidatus Paceibacterota bacterium]MCF7856882.1 30S ribosomal protein S18 [Candidatus Paceibacterota bacterium]
MVEKKTKTTNVEHYDYKDVVRLLAHMNPHSRMFNRRRTGHTAHEQRTFAQAVKRARFMALVPYVSE